MTESQNTLTDPFKMNLIVWQKDVRGDCNSDLNDESCVTIRIATAMITTYPRASAMIPAKDSTPTMRTFES